MQSASTSTPRATCARGLVFRSGIICNGYVMSEFLLYVGAPERIMMLGHTLRKTGFKHRQQNSNTKGLSTLLNSYVASSYTCPPAVVE